MTYQRDVFENTVLITGIELVMETDNAILIDYGGEEYWLPKSQLACWDKDEVEMTEWLAKKNDFA